MKCPKCGKELRGRGKFCVYCGTKIELTTEGKTSPGNNSSGNIDSRKNEQKPKNKKDNEQKSFQFKQKIDELKNSEIKDKADKALKSKNAPKIIIGAAAGLAVIFAVLLFIILSPKKLNVLKDANISYEGSNGYATASIDNYQTCLVEVWNDLFKKYDMEITSYTDADISSDAWTYFYDNASEKKQKDILKRLQKFEAIADCFKGAEFDKNDNLKNGDKITVTINVDQKSLKKLGYKAKNCKKTVKVEGLADATVVDAFEGIDELQTDGFSPNATVSVPNYEGKYKNELTIYYELDKTDNIKKGDTVTVTATLDDDYNHKYALKETEKTYTIDNISAYLTDYKEIQKDTYSAMQEQCEDIWKQRTAERAGNGFSYNSFDYDGCYLLSIKDNFSGDANYCILVYKVNASDANGAFTYYYPFTFKNIINYADGKQSVDVADCGYESGYFDHTFDHGDNSFYGYKDIDTLEVSKVDSCRENYNVTSTYEE